jgi:hypothetical protein
MYEDREGEGARQTDSRGLMSVHKCQLHGQLGAMCKGSQALCSQSIQQVQPKGKAFWQQPASNHPPTPHVPPTPPPPPPHTPQTCR